MPTISDLARADAESVIADLAGAVLDLAPHEVAALDAATRFDSAGIDIDSLARLELAGAVARFFRLHESELEDELLRRRTLGGWAATVLRGWSHGSRRLTFVTSGSTGAPVPCTHGWRILEQELAEHAAMFADRRRIVGLVGPRHIYGFLFCVLLPRWLGVPFVDARPTAPARLASVARLGDLIIGFPMRWDRAAGSDDWPPDVVGVTSTGPIDVGTVATLKARGLARMVEIYGSSQTGGVAWRDDPAAPLRLYAHWTIRADGNLSRALPGGRGEARLYEAPDVLAARDDGIDVVSRRDGAIQIAGVNVFCGRVASVVSEHPYVADCAVRAMRAEEGARLKAFIVLENGITEDTARPALRTWIRAHLSAAEAPAALAFGAMLPRDAHGKLSDWPIHGHGPDGH